jgi:hypothetical protein
MMYIVNRLTMGRLSKVVLLAVLLIIAGFPGTTSLFCAQPSGSHGHVCCMAHEQVNAAHCTAYSLAVSGTASCCKIAPIESMPVQPLPLSGVSKAGAYGLHATKQVEISAIASIRDKRFRTEGKIHRPAHPRPDRSRCSRKLQGLLPKSRFPLRLKWRDDLRSVQGSDGFRVESAKGPHKSLRAS